VLKPASHTEISNYDSSQENVTQAFWHDPTLPFVESRRACQSRACYRPHHHPTFSIGAVDEGTSIFTGAGDEPVTLHPGTLVFVPAANVHACNPAPDTAWSYQMMHLNADWLHSVRGEYADVHNGEPIRIVNEPQIYTHFCRMNALLFSQTTAENKEAALIEFIGDCDSRQGVCVGTTSTSLNAAAQIRPALDYLRAAPDADTPLSELAALTGMSRYQLIRAFRSVTGMTPHAWQLNQRINLARCFIREGDSLSSIALRLGFADQAHFQRIFKAHTGVTPGRFRA